LSIGIFLNVFARYPVVIATLLLIGGGILLGIAGLLTGITLLKILGVTLTVIGLLIPLINFFLKSASKHEST